MCQLVSFNPSFGLRYTAKCYSTFCVSDLSFTYPNFLILDKIKIYTEETFNYIINNYQFKELYSTIRKKISIVQNHIEDFKKNFNVDKYLENPDFYKTGSSAGFGKKFVDEDLVNNMVSYNGQSSNQKNKNEKETFGKTEINGMNNLILSGNFNGFQTK